MQKWIPKKCRPQDKNWSRQAGCGVEVWVCVATDLVRGNGLAIPPTSLPDTCLVRLICATKEQSQQIRLSCPHQPIKTSDTVIVKGHAKCSKQHQMYGTIGEPVNLYPFSMGGCPRPDRWSRFIHWTLKSCNMSSTRENYIALQRTGPRCQEYTHHL